MQNGVSIENAVFQQQSNRYAWKQLQVGEAKAPLDFTGRLVEHRLKLQNAVLFFYHLTWHRSQQVQRDGRWWVCSAVVDRQCI